MGELTNYNCANSANLSFQKSQKEISASIFRLINKNYYLAPNDNCIMRVFFILELEHFSSRPYSPFAAKFLPKNPLIIAEKEESLE